jgi:hypothetical protein
MEKLTFLGVSIIAKKVNHWSYQWDLKRFDR